MVHGSRKPRVLVVDDNRLDRELAREALADLARVECCADGEQALAALSREPADLVLSDLTMPGLSGLDLLVRMRREHPHAEFVLVTAHASIDSAVEALRMGASDYLCKPVRPEELALVVERTLARRDLLADNLRLREALETVEACRALTPCLEPGEVFAVALDLLLQTLGRRRGIACFHRDEALHGEGVVFRGLQEGECRPLHERWLHGKPLDLETWQELEVVSCGPLHELLAEVGIEGVRLLAVPLRGREQERGVLFVFEDGRPFGELELERARIVAGHAGLSLENAERYARAQERAYIDDVTELFNARYLLDAVVREVQRAERYGGHLAVVFLDLDRFKLVNDRHGHLVGSRALRQLGQVLQRCVRQVDTVARYGGDEFTVLLVDTDLEAGRTVAERIRRAVEEHTFEGERGTPLRLTVSVGVACYPEHGDDAEALLDLADKAMYRSKSLGRNRVSTAAELRGAAGESV